MIHKPEHVDCWADEMPEHGPCKAFRDQQQMADLQGFACFREGLPCARLKLQKAKD